MSKAVVASPVLPSHKAFRLDWPLLAILGLGLFLRLLVWFIANHKVYIIDEAEYFQIASILADGRGWQFFDDATWLRPPLYPLMLAASFKLFGPNIFIIRLIQIGLSIGSVYLLYLIGKRVYGRKTGLVAALLGSVAWSFVTLPYLLLSETLFIFLFLLSVFLMTEFLALAGENNPKPDKFWQAFLPSGKKQWFLLVGGSVFLGLSALTRGQVNSFVPFMAIWFLIALKWRWKPALGAFIILLAVFSLTIAPWTMRNFALYGRPIIDSTGGYNFYLGAMKGRNGAKVSLTLEAIKNQAERDSLGYQKGLEIFWNNPADFIFGKGVKETLDFWQINFGSDDRMLDGYTYGEVNPLWMALDGLFYDLLYVIAGALAILGMVVAPVRNRAIRSFTWIWTLQNMFLAFLFFAVARFRVSVYFFLLLFAAYPIANWREVVAWFKQPLRGSKITRWIAGLILPVAFLVAVLPSYSPVAYVLGLENKWQTWDGIQQWFNQQNLAEGDKLRLAGKNQEALAAYAKANPNISLTQLSIGLAEAELGRFDDAIGRVGRTNQDIAQTHLALGYIYNLQGNKTYARSEFNSRQIALDQTADEWAWNELPAKPLPGNYLELGDMDWGYVRGFNNPEKEPQTGKLYRWTEGRGDSGQERSLLRFPGAGGVKEVSLNLRGYRPDQLTPPQVEIYANGQLLGKIQTTRDWATYTFKLPAGLPADVTIEIGAPTFVPGAFSRRELGVMVQWARLT